MKFSEKIIKLRKEQGLSQEEFGSKIGVSRQAVSKWESEQAQPDIEKIKEISRIFNVGYDYLLDDENDGNTVRKSETSIKSKINKKKVFKIILIVLVICFLLYLGYGVYKYIKMSRLYARISVCANDADVSSLYTSFEQYPIQKKQKCVIFYTYVLEPIELCVLYSESTNLVENLKYCSAFYKNTETNKVYQIMWDGKKYVEIPQDECYGTSPDYEEIEQPNIDTENVYTESGCLWKDYPLIAIIAACLDPRVVCTDTYIKYWVGSECRIIELYSEWSGRIKKIYTYGSDYVYGNYTRIENMDYYYENIDMMEKIHKINTIGDFVDILGIELSVEQ